MGSIDSPYSRPWVMNLEGIAGGIQLLNICISLSLMIGAKEKGRPSTAVFILHKYPIMSPIPTYLIMYVRILPDLSIISTESRSMYSHEIGKSQYMSTEQSKHTVSTRAKEEYQKHNIFHESTHLLAN